LAKSVGVRGCDAHRAGLQRATLWRLSFPTFGSQIGREFIFWALHSQLVIGAWPLLSQAVY
jgi:hypothetical protein